MKMWINLNLSVNFLTKFSSILDMLAPLTKLSKQKLKSKSNAWKAIGLQQSISIKANLFTKYIRLKDLTMKNEAQTIQKQYRHLLSTLLRESKRSHFIKYFQDNLNDLKST